MKWMLLSLLAFMLGAPPIAVHASPDDPLCTVLADTGNAADLVQALAARPAVSTVAPNATADPDLMITNATASPVQEVAALPRCSERPAKAPVVLAYDQRYASGGDGYVISPMSGDPLRCSGSNRTRLQSKARSLRGGRVFLWTSVYLPPWIV